MHMFSVIPFDLFIFHIIFKFNLVTQIVSKKILPLTTSVNVDLCYLDYQELCLNQCIRTYSLVCWNYRPHLINQVYLYFAIQFRCTNSFLKINVVNYISEC